MLNEGDKANELNDFFCTFESRDFSQEQQAALDCLPALDSAEMIIDQQVVERLFSQICPGKACGPDGISGRLFT